MLRNIFLTAGARGGNQDMGLQKHKTASGLGCAQYANQGHYTEATKTDCTRYLA